MVAVKKLTTSLKSLVEDTKFIDQSKRLGILDLNDMMNVSLDKLRQHQEFTLSWYADILDLLQQHGLLRKFQEKNI